MTPHYEDDLVTLYHADCLDVLREMPDASVDSVVTDPPYELTAGKKGGTGVASLNVNSPAGRSRIGTGNAGGFMGKKWDATGIAHNPVLWAECLRVLKPGGHLLAFGGTRTWHRLAVAIEDAGFQIRDSIAFMYGSGFPKSLDVSKAIDKAAGVERDRDAPQRRVNASASIVVSGFGADGWAPQSRVPVTPDAARWQGWGTATKPAFEPIVVARKPLDGTVAANVLKHGTGALNIAACRIGTADGHGGGRKASSGFVDGYEQDGFAASTVGRWPANVVLDDYSSAELDRQSGTTTSRIGKPRGSDAGDGWGMTATGAEYDDIGGASRFFYTAKAGNDERPGVDGVAHPTVKPLSLMRWLVRLVTPPGGTVLEPFAGSGTTAEACIIEGFRCIAVEREDSYLPLIVARLTKPIQPDLFGGAA